MLRLQSAFARMAEKVLNRAEPRHLTARGKVTSVTKNSGGGISLVEVTVDGVPYTQVRPNGEAGLALGATVDLDGTGEAGSSVDWAVKRVVESAAGGASTDPHGELSTPSIYDVEARVSIMPDGTVITTLDVIVELIAEQYRQRQRIFYETTIRDANTGATLGIGQSIVLERVEGSLHANILSGATSATVNKITGGAEFRFPFNKGVVEMGSELMQYSSITTVSPTQITLTSLTRGYDSTSAAAHTAGDRVTLRGLPITKEVATVEEYEITVRAINQTDGRVSNWSDAFNYAHSGDTTPPTWGGGTNLATNAITGGTRLTWDSADTDATDLAYYEIQDSTDGSTGGTTYNAGSGNAWVFNARYGALRWFRIRAADRSGNVSSWSSWVRGGIDKGVDHVDYTSLLTNGAFASNTTGWTTTGTGSLNHDSSRGFKAAGSARLEITRSGASLDYGIYQNITGLNSGDVMKGIAYAVRSSNFAQTLDEVWLELRCTGAVSLSIIAKGSGLKVVDTGEWTILEADVVIPSGQSSVEVYVWANYSGTPSEVANVWVDDVQLYRIGNKS